MKRTSGYTSSAKYKCLEDLQKESVEICLIYCGWEYCEPCHRYGPNRRTCYILHIVREGRGTLEMNGKTYRIGAGEAFMIQPHTEAWYEADKEEPWSYMWIGFTGLKAGQYAQSAGFTAKIPVRRVGCIKKVNHFIDEILKSHQLSFANELRRNGLLMLILSELIRDYEEASGAGASYQYPGSVYVKHAVEYIAGNYNKKIKINELADYIGVNRSYLTNSFKKNMGCSPQEYLVNIRMEKARSLLEKTDMQINVIANEIGYSDQLAFSKIFKQHYGMSPKAYRNVEHELVISSQKGEYPVQFR